MLGDKRGKKLQKYIRDYVVFDLETTGISTTYDQVIELSAVKVENGRPKTEFSTLVNPGRRIPPAASRVNGITDEMVRNAPAFPAVLKTFLEFAGDLPLVGHNIHSFDMKFIYRDAQQIFGKIPGNDYVDTLSMARRCLPGLASYKLVDLAAYYGILAEGAHRALNDCRMNQQVFERLAQEQQTVPTLDSKTKICPRCGGIMIKRSGRYGEFWGCSSFPMCRYTENI